MEEKVKYQVFISKKERRENVLLVKGDENGGASAVVGYFLTVNNRDVYCTVELCKKNLPLVHPLAFEANST